MERSIRRANIILIMIILSWFTSLIINVFQISGLFYLDYVSESITKIFLIIMTFLSTTYSMLLGFRQLTQDSEEIISQKLLIIPLFFSLSVLVPMAYAFTYQQQTHSFIQSISSLPLLDNDFDDLIPPQGPLGWSTIGGTWSTSYDEENVIYKQLDIKEKKALSIAPSGSSTWHNYTYEVRLKFVNGNQKKRDAGALLIFRFQDKNHYYFLKIEEYQDVIRLFNRGSEALDFQVASAPVNLEVGVWYSITIKIEGQIVSVWVDDIIYLENINMNGNFDVGHVGIGTRYYEVYFDEIKVTRI